MQDRKQDNLISAQAAQRLIAAHDGDVALLYLYIRHSGCRDKEQAARVLCRTLREMEAAEEKLQRMGLLDEGQAPADTGAKVPLPLPADELPPYTAREITQRAKSDSTFQAILDEAVKVLGKQLSSPDLRILFAIYEQLPLPPEVLLEMINFCGEIFQERYGTGRRPTMRTLQKEAFTWVNRELLTLEQAEEYIRREKEKLSGLRRIKNLLGIYDRQLSSSETEAISAWLEMGFGEEAISMAFDRTVTRTGGFKLNYMNKILRSWHENGLHSTAEIEARDPVRSKTPAVTGKTGSIDLGELDSLVDKI